MNIRIGLFWLFLAAVGVAAVFFPAGIYGEERVYTVQKGETFYSIARNYGIIAEDLMRFNGITDPARLQAGQRLKIPNNSAAGQSVAAETAAYVSYRVVRGDTFYGITRKFSVTEKQIREANNLPDKYVLREGDSLKIPQKAVAASVPQKPAVTAAPVPQPKTEPEGPVAANRVSPPAPDTKAPGSSLIWPVAAREISYMTGKLSGVVITGTRAEPVKSLTWGTILSAGPYRGFGQVAIVQVEGGYLYVYGGCESLSVKEGDKVGPGTELGKLGIDAVSAKPQLFFMVYRSNTPIDPAKAPRA